MWIWSSAPPDTSHDPAAATQRTGPCRGPRGGERVVDGRRLARCNHHLQGHTAATRTRRCSHAPGARGTRSLWAVPWSPVAKGARGADEGTAGGCTSAPRQPRGLGAAAGTTLPCPALPGAPWGPGAAGTQIETARSSRPLGGMRTWLPSPASGGGEAWRSGLLAMRERHGHDHFLVATCVVRAPACPRTKPSAAVKLRRAATWGGKRGVRRLWSICWLKSEPKGQAHV